MPDISEIPNASDMQQQLVNIEQAIASLKAGSSVFAIGVSAPPVDPIEQPEGTLPVNTRVELYPPITDPTSLANITTALEGQKQALITELESWGYTYSGSATPPVADLGPKAPSLVPPLPPVYMPPPVAPPQPVVLPPIPPPPPPPVIPEWASEPPAEPLQAVPGSPPPPPLAG